MFFFCLGDVCINDPFIFHLMYKIGKFCLAAPLSLEFEFTLMFGAVFGSSSYNFFCYVLADLGLPRIVLIVHTHYLNVHTKGQLFWLFYCLWLF